MFALILSAALGQWSPQPPGMLQYDPGAQCQRTGGRCAKNRTSNRPVDSLGLLAFAPASGVGMGVACACTTPQLADGTSITFARSTVGECYSNDGQTLTQCGVNQPRVSSGIATSTQLGIWKEPLRNNTALQSRDLSVAPWARVSMTCTRTATGMRGDTNGASTCTATGANGTVLQPITYLAATQNTSFHLKRRTGTGTVEVTRDNGVTWSAVNASLSTTLWKRVVSAEVPGCAGGNCIVVSAMTSGIANPTIGIRVVTSGDAVDVDFVQDEETAVASTPIATAGAGASRDVDYIDLPFSYTGTSAGLTSSAEYVTGGPWSNGSTGALVATNGVLGAASFGATYWLLYPATSLGGFAADSAGVVSAGLASYNPGLDVFPTSTIVYAGGLRHDGSKWQVCQAGLCGPASGSSTFGTPVFTRVLLGRLTSAAANQFSGVIKDVCVDPARCTTRFDPTQSVWIGDSIPGGTGSAPLDPVLQLRGLSGKWVTNAGIGAHTTVQCAARYTSTYQTGFAKIVWMCGVNSMIAGVTGAQAATDTQTVLADARSRGYKVIVVGIAPWKGYASWTAGRQTETDAYNSAMSTWAASNGATYVSPASLGGQGGDPAVMLLTYDSGDGLHPNSTGAGVLAALVNAVFP